MTILNLYAPAAAPSSEKLSKVVGRFLVYIVAQALRPPDKRTMVARIDEDMTFY